MNVLRTLCMLFFGMLVFPDTVSGTAVAGAIENCEASYYTGGNAQTASGMQFDKDNKNIVAHKHLPFGTRVRIRNTRNGRTLVAEVQDRGPYVAGRCVDVTRAGAVVLGMLHSGVAPVQVEVLN